MKPFGLESAIPSGSIEAAVDDLVVGSAKGRAVIRQQLSELYDRHRAELVKFALVKFGLGPPEPEDIVQEAFANLAALAPGSNIINPRAFLFRTVHNIAINARKRRQVGQRLFDPAPNPQDLHDARTDWDPQVLLLGKEQYALIEQVIRNMPERRRVILHLNRFEGLSYAEIARQLNLCESVVRKHAAIAVRECAAVMLTPATKSRKAGHCHD